MPGRRADGGVPDPRRSTGHAGAELSTTTSAVAASAEMQQGLHGVLQVDGDPAVPRPPL